MKKITLNNLDIIHYSILFKSAMVNCNISKWSHCNILYVLYAENSNSQKCIEYVRYKDVFKYEQYLSNVVIPKFRKALTCLRLSSHDLLIEKGRHINLPRRKIMYILWFRGDRRWVSFHFKMSFFFRNQTKVPSRFLCYKLFTFQLL